MLVVFSFYGWGTDLLVGYWSTRVKTPFTVIMPSVKAHFQPYIVGVVTETAAEQIDTADETRIFVNGHAERDVSGVRQP